MIETILNIQPRISAAAGVGKSPDDIVMELASKFEIELPLKLLRE
jgi:hypothetical protein